MTKNSKYNRPFANLRTVVGSDWARAFFLGLIVLAGSARIAMAQETMIVLSNATEGTAYSEQLTTAGTGPYSWSVLNGTLPAGLNFTGTGQLSGTPAAGSHRLKPYIFKVQVVDSSAPAVTTVQWLSVSVVAPPPPVVAPLITPAGRPTKPVPVPFRLTTSTADEETIALALNFATPPPPLTFEPDTSDANVAALRQIIAETIGTNLKPSANADPGPNEFEVGDYCALHTIVWKPLADNKSEPDRTIWALFKAVKATDMSVAWEPVISSTDKRVFDTRIMGSKRVVVLLANLNTPASWDVKYTVTINQKIPTPLQHLLELAPTILGGGAPAPPKNIWGARMMLIRYRASDMVVKLTGLTAGPGGRPIEQSKEQSKEYDNEGKYHWDISVGLPVQSVRQLQFKSDGNQVVAEAKEKQSVYGFLNLYPIPVDLKSKDFFTLPHLVIGVPLASKPLQRPFLGLGTGIFKTPVKFNIFGGIVFIRERVPRTLAEGDPATAQQLEGDLRTRWVRKFMFGINLPVSQIKDAIKK
jgi:hypothetical protein